MKSASELPAKVASRRGLSLAAAPRAVPRLVRRWPGPLGMRFAVGVWGHIFKFEENIAGCGEPGLNTHDSLGSHALNHATIRGPESASNSLGRSLTAQNDDSVVLPRTLQELFAPPGRPHAKNKLMKHAAPEYACVDSFVLEAQSRLADQPFIGGRPETPARKLDVGLVASNGHACRWTESARHDQNGLDSG